MTTKYVGLVDGAHRWDVIDAQGQVVGFNESEYGPGETVPSVKLEPVEVLAALLAATGILTAEDAANAVGLTSAQLTAEAESWAL